MWFGVVYRPVRCLGGLQVLFGVSGRCVRDLQLWFDMVCPVGQCVYGLQVWFDVVCLLGLYAFCTCGFVLCVQLVWCTCFPGVVWFDLCGVRGFQV